MSDFREFVDDYYRRFVEILEAFDRAPMAGVLATLEQVRDAGGTIWVAGNGGSAAIADHTVCDRHQGNARRGSAAAPNDLAQFECRDADGTLERHRL